MFADWYKILIDSDTNKGFAVLPKKIKGKWVAVDKKVYSVVCGRNTWKILAKAENYSEVLKLAKQNLDNKVWKGVYNPRNVGMSNKSK